MRIRHVGRVHQVGSGDPRWDRDDRVPLRRFRYLLEPLCLAAIAAYAVNRWIVRPEFLRGWFNDILFLPAALPIFLWIERRIGLRKTDEPPRGGEIIFYLIAWSVAAEVIGPWVFSHATADPWDVLWYCLGAAICWAVWATSAPGSECQGGRVRGPRCGP